MAIQLLLFFLNDTALTVLYSLMPEFVHAAKQLWLNSIQFYIRVPSLARLIGSSSKQSPSDQPELK